jgi:hypothetical protein
VTIKLFDLAGAEPDRRFSPYCWRTKLALAHKGLTVEMIPWRLSETHAVEMSGQRRVPVLLDGDKVVSDSWTIAEYLEDTYQHRPFLFGSAEARASTRFINSWADTVVNGALVRLLLTDIYAHLHEKDRRYFRESREKRFGMPLEEVSADRDTRVVGSVKVWNRLEPSSRLSPTLPEAGRSMPTTSYSDASCGLAASAASAY